MSGRVDGLTTGQVYYFAPVVTDVYGRMWRGQTVYVTAGALAPSVTLAEIVAYSDSARGMINVVSEVPLTALTVRLQPVGGGAYINATVPAVTTGVQQWTVTGLTPETSYNVVATATSSAGSGMASRQLMTTASGNAALLQDAAPYGEDPTSMIFVEVQGVVDTGMQVYAVGASAFTTNDHTGTPSATVEGARYSDFLSDNITGLSAGTTYYVFGYMDYENQTTQTMHRVWSSGEAVLLAPTVQWSESSHVSDTRYMGGVIVGGDIATTNVTVQYKLSSDVNWSYVAVDANGEFVINGLTANTTYDLAATATNASGSSTVKKSFTTPAIKEIVTITTISDITYDSAVATIAYNNI